ARLEPGEQRHADATEKTCQALDAGLAIGQLPIALVELGTAGSDVDFGQRRQLRWRRQLRNLPLADRTMPATPRRLMITEVVGQPPTEAFARLEQREHVVYAGDFTGFMLLEVGVQLGTQRVCIEVRIEQRID